MVELDLSSGTPTVRFALSQLFVRKDCVGLSGLILDGESSDARSSALILVSGREIGTLEGLETKLKDEDEVSLLPVAHGG
jgi:molybdopterin converting factor small subunit